MPMFRADAQPILPDEIGQLVVQPVQAASVAMLTTTTVTTSAAVFRVPIITDDPAAAWVAEGDAIPEDTASFDEDEVRPAKVAGLTIVTRELAEDSDPAAADVIGDGLARDIARRIDAAFFGALVAPAPPGLGALTGVQTVASGGFASLDPFAEAVSRAEQVGAVLSAFITDPATALALSTLKESDGSRRALLGSDPAQPGQRQVLGVPLLTSAAVAPGTVWGYDRSRVWTVIRDDVRLEVDRSRYFESDRVAVKATMRVGFSFAHPQSVVRIAAAAPAA